jgi:hypothetical protein
MKRMFEYFLQRRVGATFWPVATIAIGAVMAACGGSGDSTTGATGASLKSGYQQAKWSTTGDMSVTFTGDCSMTITTNDLPNHEMATYYLEPVNLDYKEAVATNFAGSLSIQPNNRTAVNQTYTVNICPTKASTPSATNMGTIGIMVSGADLFNAFEGNGKTVALTDNASAVAPDGTVAKFLDKCNGHYAPARGQTGSNGQYHYHALPKCITDQVDTSGGPSHLIGVAADGFPIYGGRDINGNVLTVSQLDECNGITSATPEFPKGVYHYVLPEGVTDKKSSMNCYAGTVSPMMALSIAQSTNICLVNRAPSVLARNAIQPLQKRPYAGAVSRAS